MPLSSSPTSPSDRLLSWASLLVLTAVAIGFGWYIPHIRSREISAFRDLHLELPTATVIACAIPAFVFVVISVLAVASGAAVQWRAQSKLVALIFNLLLTALLGVALLAFQCAMQAPFDSIIHSISSGAPGK